MPAIFSMKWPFHEITAKCFDLKNELWLFRGFQHLRKNTKFKLRGIQKCNDRASHLNGQWTDERREKKRGRGGHGQRRERERWLNRMRDKKIDRLRERYT